MPIASPMSLLRHGAGNARIAATRTIVASTPKCASAVTSVSAVRWSALFADAASLGEDFRTLRSGRTYSPSLGGASKRTVCSSVIPSGSSSSGGGSDNPSETTSG